MPGRRSIGGFAPTDVLVVLGCFFASRLLLTLIGIVVLSGDPVITWSPFQTAPFTPSVPDLYVRWDSFWYMALAEHGYSPLSPPGMDGSTNYAFYPLYPLLMGALARLTGMATDMAGFIVSNVCFVAALFVVFALVERWSDDRRVAALSVALLCFVPESFVFSAVYTESLFLLLTAGAMLLFARGQNAAAGLVAALSAATRSTGVFVAIWFGLSLVREHGIVGALQFWKRPERYLPIIMAPLGLFAFWWFAMLTTGDAFAQKSTMIHGWQWQTDLPWRNIRALLVDGDFRDRLLMGANLAMFAAALTLLRRDSWPLFVYCLASFLLFWTGNLANSLLRYTIVLFPIFYGLARVTAPRPPLAVALLAVFALLDGVLMAMWALGSGLTL